MSSSNNYVIKIAAIDLSATDPTLISDVSIQNSSIGIITINTLSGDLVSLENILKIDSFSAIDCTFDNDIDIMTLGNLVTNQAYAVEVSIFNYQNLVFLRSGSMKILGIR